jgi:hypothetical protein
MRPHTTLQVSTAGKKYYADTYVVVYSRHRPICVLIPLHVCPHTTIHVCTAGRRATPACCDQESYQLSKCLHTATFVSTYYYMCALIHTTICASSYYYICALILLHLCPHTSICVLILLYVPSYYYMCPHTNYVVFITTQTCHGGPLYYSSRLANLKNFNYYIFKKNFNYYTIVCVLMLLYVSSYYYISVRIILYICPHTAICVLILMYVCPHTTIYVSSYYTWVLRPLADVCAVVELGKLDGNHLSMMLSLVSTDPALP